MAGGPSRAALRDEVPARSSTIRTRAKQGPKQGRAALLREPTAGDQINKAAHKAGLGANGRNFHERETHGQPAQSSPPGHQLTGGDERTSPTYRGKAERTSRGHARRPPKTHCHQVEQQRLPPPHATRQARRHSNTGQPHPVSGKDIAAEPNRQPSGPDAERKPHQTPRPDAPVAR